MKVFISFLSLIVVSLCLNDAYSFELENDYKAEWAGIELIVPDLRLKEELRNFVPIKIGDTFKASEARQFSNLCSDQIKEKTAYREVSCSILWYGDGMAYLIVDVPENASKKYFREIPVKKTKMLQLPEVLNTLYKQWEARFSFLMSSQQYPIEIFKDEYIDYEDPVLHGLALKLKEAASKNINILLDIINYSHSVEERRKAATLFSWARGVKNLELILNWEILADPDPTVRNNIARSFANYMHTIKKNDNLLKKFINAYCDQALLPKFSDRNKALFAIKDILENNPNLASSVTSDCKRHIEYLQKESVLPNIHEPAKGIMNIINSA